MKTSKRNMHSTKTAQPQAVTLGQVIDNYLHLPLKPDAHNPMHQNAIAKKTHILNVITEHTNKKMLFPIRNISDIPVGNGPNAVTSTDIATGIIYGQFKEQFSALPPEQQRIFVGATMESVQNNIATIAEQNAKERGPVSTISKTTTNHQTKIHKTARNFRHTSQEPQPRVTFAEKIKPSESGILKPSPTLTVRNRTDNPPKVIDVIEQLVESSFSVMDTFVSIRNAKRTGDQRAYENATEALKHERESIQANIVEGINGALLHSGEKDPIKYTSRVGDGPNQISTKHITYGLVVARYEGVFESASPEEQKAIYQECKQDVEVAINTVRNIDATKSKGGISF